MFPRILVLTSSTHFIHSYAASQSNGGFLCHYKTALFLRIQLLQLKTGCYICN